MLRPADGILARFTRDLTADARAGRLEPVRSRDAEISRVIDILLRQGKNNPALVGPAGVGKTAIVEGLAQRVAAGDVPLSLRGIRVLAVDHVSLLAGTMYRGQYEERIRGLVAECTASPDAVLFIDELHNLIGQGSAVGVAMDAANMLKPALVRGDFRVIGATTDDEYDRWVCGDPALERRFQKIAVRELSSDETLEILRARRAGLERHHNVVVGDDALAAAVRLTDEHITDRTRPDRAIDVLDEACAHAQAAARHTPRTEALIRARRALLVSPAHEGRRAHLPPAGATDDAADDELVDPFDRFARGGFAALERFGAELEAMLSGEPAPAGPPSPPPGPAAAPLHAEHPAPFAPVSGRTLAEVEVELRQRLMEEGVVVRGHDVARVVAIASGRRVVWAE